VSLSPTVLLPLPDLRAQVARAWINIAVGSFAAFHFTACSPHRGLRASAFSQHPPLLPGDSSHTVRTLASPLDWSFISTLLTVFFYIQSTFLPEVPLPPEDLQHRLNPINFIITSTSAYSVCIWVLTLGETASWASRDQLTLERTWLWGGGVTQWRIGARAYSLGLELGRVRVENKSGRLEGNKLQVCPCSWQKVTSVGGLKMHQGIKKCVVKEGQCGCIDHYFLRSQSSKSDEVRRISITQLRRWRRRF